MSDAIEIRGIDFLLYLVKELPRAKAFYEGAFGLETTEFNTEFYVEYVLPDGNAFALARLPGDEPTPACGCAIFGVPDLAQAMEHVVSLGATIKMEIPGERCKSAWCADTEGNTFGLHQRM